MGIREKLRAISSGYAAGTVGTVFAVGAEWALRHFEIPDHFGVDLLWSWNGPTLALRFVIGGLFGILFASPVFKSRGLFERGLLLGLVPTFFVLIYVFKFVTGDGFFGFERGALTPAFILGLGAIWGWASAAWIKWVG